MTPQRPLPTCDTIQDASWPSLLQGHTANSCSTCGPPEHTSLSPKLLSWQLSSISEEVLASFCAPHGISMVGKSDYRQNPAHSN